MVSLEAGEREDTAPISQAMRFPAGRPRELETSTRMGLRAEVCEQADGALRLRVETGRLAYGVGVHVPGFHPPMTPSPSSPGASGRARLPRTANATFAGAEL